MNLLFWGLTIGLAGKILLVIGVLLAHNQIAHEHKIDNAVLKSFKKEKIITILGLLLIIIGYLMEVYFYGFAQMLTCSGVECAANLGALLSP